MDKIYKYNCSLDLTSKIITFVYSILVIICSIIVYNKFTILILVVLFILSTIWIFCFTTKPNSYTISHSSLKIKTILRVVCVSYNDISTVQIINSSNKKDFTRVFGNFGLFGYSGLYSFQSYDLIRFYCTNLDKIILISLKNEKKIAISPNKVQDFQETLNIILNKRQ